MPKLSEVGTHLSFRDWPWPIYPSRNKPLRVYRKAIEIFLDTDFLPASPLTDTALGIYDHLLPEFLSKARWANYAIEEMGDMNCGGHSMRQAGITAQALVYDAEQLGLFFPERDMMIAAAVIHDLGEIVVGDVTYDLKQVSKREMDMAEGRAVMDIIDRFEGLDPNLRNQLKLVYLKITTGLNELDIKELMGSTGDSIGNTHWELMRTQFKLYERYGYLMTAFQIYPLGLEATNLIDADRELVVRGNRSELEAALKVREVGPSIRMAVTAKNVLLNQWGHIETSAQGGCRSAQILFNNTLVNKAIPQANALMGLNLTTLAI